MTVGIQTRGHVALIEIQRPEALNAIDPETSDALVEAWIRVRDDDEIRVAIITGAGEKAFSAGVDIKKMGEWYARAPPHKRREVWGREPGLAGITRNLDVGKPVIAAVNGICFGGGLELALACDVRIASDNASFALPEVKLGIIPGQGGTQRLARVVPVGVALEMIVTGDPIDAQRALSVGLVNRVVPLAELMPTALMMAETIARRAPRAVRHAREAVLCGLEMPLDQALRLEGSLAEPLRDSEDNVEGRNAFAQKREPRWTGR